MAVQNTARSELTHVLPSMKQQSNVVGNLPPQAALRNRTQSDERTLRKLFTGQGHLELSPDLPFDDRRGNIFVNFHFCVEFSVLSAGYRYIEIFRESDSEFVHFAFPYAKFRERLIGSIQ